MEFKKYLKVTKIYAYGVKNFISFAKTLKMRLLLFILFVNVLSAQELSCFDLARKGTIESIKERYYKDKSIVNQIDKYGSSMLILACYKGNSDVAHFLIENNANVNYVSENGTALMAAVVKGNIALVQKLLEFNANPNLTDGNGVTALMYAVQFSNVELVQLLLKYNANKHHINAEGKSVFEYAVTTKNEEIINLIK